MIEQIASFVRFNAKSSLNTSTFSLKLLSTNQVLLC